ncbi:MAG: four helix bundle protein [Patescibacteria group bacterium]|nr:four helix bundle protein [Patescibacteria group bacterium]
MITAFTELVVRQKAHQLMLDAYTFANTLPGEERYNRVSQLKRSASSVSANIAEGFGRFHFQENIQFCRQARGSLEETANHILAAIDLGQGKNDAGRKLLLQCEEVRKLLNGYIRSIRETQKSIK